jgi:hypothetical protein
MSRHKLHSVREAKWGTETEWRVLEAVKCLETTSVTDLKAKFTTLMGREPPHFAKRSLLTQLIAWELQANAFGGLDAILRRQLLALGTKGKTSGYDTEACAAPPALRPGVKLIRSWKGVTHHVTVTNSGYVWHDRPYKSLSVIAREITGTSWSGPVFFGLKKSKSTAAKVPNTGVEAHG